MTYGLSDADWASDEKDRRSVSGYSFFFLNSLVSGLPESNKLFDFLYGVGILHSDQRN